MKTNYTILLLLSCSMAIFGCSRKVNFNVSTVVPAARGSMKVVQDRNNNYVLDLDVIRLAEPERLTPPKLTYVVWMETEANGTQNVGQLNSSETWLSHKLRSSLNTVTAYKPVAFFITAEDVGNTETPGAYVVMRTDRLR